MVPGVKSISPSISKLQLETEGQGSGTYLQKAVFSAVNFIQNSESMLAGHRLFVQTFTLGVQGLGLDIPAITTKLHMIGELQLIPNQMNTTQQRTLDQVHDQKASEVRKIEEERRDFLDEKDKEKRERDAHLHKQEGERKDIAAKPLPEVKVDHETKDHGTAKGHETKDTEIETTKDHKTKHEHGTTKHHHEVKKEPEAKKEHGTKKEHKIKKEHEIKKEDHGKGHETKSTETTEIKDAHTKKDHGKAKHEIKEH
jgi:outer membrane biosynthesis protein TonB